MYRKGYFMSNEQEQAAKGQLFLEYQETKYHMGVLRAAADKLAEKFEKTAKQLREAPERMTFDAAALIQYNEELHKLLADFAVTREEFNRLGARVNESGLAHLLKD
jgi:chromosome segregation ATPase